ncbi:ferredoxin family protein [Serratia microhaemolytica]|uniref:ferredoxin family protein n=1 Tax=Serratia microhaemolytica TaxID=2675110 RepID=UPI000FDDE037|nr:ferredoxin family protein [Serratia microhaemolytica]
MNYPDLSHNIYQFEPEHQHIILATAAEHAMLRRLATACPAGLYQFQPDGSLHFEWQGCLECGACRLLCDAETLSRWRYPNAGYGVIFRFG